MGNCFGQGGGGKHPVDEAVRPGNTARSGGGSAGSKGPPPQAILDSSSGKAFGEVYKMGDKLGEGAFSVVKKGSHRQTQKSYAIKIVTKSKLTKEDEVALKDEIDILTRLVVKFFTIN
jgi:serine/threonine protein kinase